MDIIYYGHSCVGININNTNLLFDPFITGNELAKNIDVSKIKADYILISHGHEDHMADAVSIASRTNATIISNYEIVEWISYKYQIQNTHSMNVGGEWKFNFGTLKFVNAIHSSSMPDGKYGGTAGGFVVDTNEGSFYFGGDTALNYDMKLIGEQYKLKFAFLPIGNNFTMGIDDAVIAANFIQCKNIIGIHYDTFKNITINHNEAKEKFSKMKIRLTLLDIGASMKI